MRRVFAVAMLLLSATNAFCSDISIRFGNGLSGQQARGLFDFNPSSDGKILQVAYSHHPWRERKGWLRNLYVEAAAGIHSEIDFGKITSSVFEVAPGARVSFGSVRMWLSHGLGYFSHFRDIPSRQFATRLGVAFVDSVSGVSIGLERSHYSTGSVNRFEFSGADYVGFTLSIPVSAENR